LFRQDFERINRVLSADMPKTYRQAWVSGAHCVGQRILRRSAPDQPIQTFRLKTVTYGTWSFSTTARVEKSSEENHSKYPQTCRAIREDFHTDDLLTGANPIEDGDGFRPFSARSSSGGPPETRGLTRAMPRSDQRPSVPFLWERIGRRNVQTGGPRCFVSSGIADTTSPFARLLDLDYPRTGKPMSADRSYPGTTLWR